jgi:hypothetical protein
MQASNTPDAKVDSHVSFLSLPRVGEGMSQTSEHQSSILLESKSASIGELIVPSARADFRESYKINTQKNSLSIFLNSTSGLSDPSAIASFTLQEGRLTFSWGSSDQDRARVIDTLRDSVLTIQDTASSRRYVLLRNPGVVRKNDAFSLTQDGTGAPNPNSKKKREVNFPWVSNPGEWKDGKLELFIRRWKVTSWLSENGEPIPITSGEHGSPGEPISEDIIPGEVRLVLKLDSTNKATVKVVLEFLKPDPKSNRQERDRLIAAFLDSNDPEGKGGTVPATPVDRNKSIQGRLRKIEETLQRDAEAVLPGASKDQSKRSLQIASALKDLKDRRGDDAKRKEEFKELEDRFGALDEAKKKWEINQKEDCLHYACRSQLCLVISLKADSSTVIDVAKIGNW